MTPFFSAAQLIFSPLRSLQRTANEDLSHLRSQSITVEVNMARLFNHDVKRRKLLQQTVSPCSA